MRLAAATARTGQEFRIQAGAAASRARQPLPVRRLSGSLAQTAASRVGGSRAGVAAPGVTQAPAGAGADDRFHHSPVTRRTSAKAMPAWSSMLSCPRRRSVSACSHPLTGDRCGRLADLVQGSRSGGCRRRRRTGVAARAADEAAMTLAAQGPVLRGPRSNALRLGCRSGHPRRSLVCRLTRGRGCRLRRRRSVRRSHRDAGARITSARRCPRPSSGGRGSGWGFRRAVRGWVSAASGAARVAWLAYGLEQSRVRRRDKAGVGILPLSRWDGGGGSCGGGGGGGGATGGDAARTYALRVW